MKVTMGERSWSSSAFGFSGSLGGWTTTSTLWTPPPFSRFSFSKVNPCFLQTVAATSA
jgi:hypothetical protein